MSHDIAGPIPIDKRVDGADPVYLCRKISLAIEIDGDLSKPVWELARAISLVDNMTGDVPTRKTAVKLLFNDQYLYVGFHCEDDEVTATMTRFNDRLYEEEAVEIFLDDDRDLRTYQEFEVNPLNAVVHYAVHNDLCGNVRFFSRLENVVSSAVLKRLEAGFISVEMAVPLAEFITSGHSPPEAGDKWRMNLYRIKRPRGEPAGYSAWSPTGKLEFHVPGCFGWLVFTNDLTT